MKNWNFQSALLFFAGMLALVVPARGAGFTGGTDSVEIQITKGQVLTRTLTLFPDAQVESLELKLGEFLDSQSTTAFPAEAIRVETLPAGLNAAEANKPLNIQITISLQQTKVHSEKYSGVIYLVYDGGVEDVSIGISVKDKPGPPLILLFFGVLIGWAANYYKEKVMPFDKLKEKYGALHVKFQSFQEAMESTSFAGKIEKEFNRVREKFEASDKDAVEAELAKIDELLSKWENSPSAWADAFSGYEKLERKLKNQIKKMPGRRFLNGMQLALQGLYDNAPTEEATTPESFHDKINKYDFEQDDYVALQESLTEIESLVKKLPTPELKKKWNAKRITFTKTWEDLVFASDQLVAGDLKNEVFAAVQELRAVIDPTESARPNGVIESAPTTEEDEPPKTVSPEQAAAKARRNLAVAGTIVVSLFLVILVLLSFQELYVAKDTFGSQGMTDYLSLLLVGFGSEATRGTVESVLKAWSL